MFDSAKTLACTTGEVRPLDLCSTANNTFVTHVTGFAIMICGTFTYYKVVRLPFCNYEPEENNKAQEEVQRMRESDERLLAGDHRINSIDDPRRTKRGASDV